jgi:hypothetical protein
MIEFIKKIFKCKKPERIPGVNYVEVNRVPINRVEVEKFEPKLFEPRHVMPMWRYQYTDTGEIVEKPSREAVDEILSSMRPIKYLGSFEKKLD